MKRVVLLAFVGCTLAAYSQDSKHTAPMYHSYKGLVMCGYQGWFRADGDGTNSGWGHFGRDGKFDSDHNTIDIWPEVSEYEKTYETSFKNKDGSRANVFSSVDESATDLHFKWMKDYGIDGVFMQRFYNVTRGPENRLSQDRILDNAFKASQKYDRAIAVMYDLSGLRHGRDDCSTVIDDWKHLVDDLKVKNRGNKQTYLHH